MDDGSYGASAAAAPSSSSPHQYPDWVMLDPHNLLLECAPKGTPDYSDDHLRSTSAHAMTSKGDLIRVSVRAVPPPEVSRLSVSCPLTRHSFLAENRWSSPYEWESLVVAAHGSFILLSRGRRYEYDYSPEFFVYTVGSAGPPTLRLLPSRSTSNNIGLLCDGDTNEFVLADLDILSGERRGYYRETSEDIDTTVVAEALLYVLRSGGPRCGWTAVAPRPRIRHKKGQDIDLYSWLTDEVVPCGDALSYVDYTRGVLFVDVLRECPEVRYVRLPAVKVTVTDPYDLDTFAGHRRARGIHPERSLSATDGGRTVKFVEVVTTTVFISRGRTTASALFNINVWMLRRDDKDMTWEKESGMEDSDLWALEGYDDLPRVAPTFPRVSLEEPNVIYFVLSSHRQADDDETWVIAVDMSNKTLRSSFRYTKQASESQAANFAFIPCKFSKDLQVPGTG